MLRKSPMNYLAASGLAALLWLVTGLFLGNYLGDNVTLQSLTTERFLVFYRIGTGVASAIALVLCFSWFMSGAKPAAATNPAGNRKRWIGLFIGQIVVAALAIVALVISMLSESVTAADYIAMFGALLVDTALFFWLSTFAMSPSSVEAVVPGKR